MSTSRALPTLTHLDELESEAVHVFREVAAELERLLVRRRDTGEVLDLAGERGRVKALRIAARALLERRRDVDLDERRMLLDE